MRDLRGCSCFFVSISITPNPLRIRPFRVARKHAGTGETPHRLVHYALSIGGEGGIFHFPWNHGVACLKRNGASRRQKISDCIGYL